MSFKDTLKTALWGLKANKVRSFLTILGITIGITAIILISSLGGNTEKIIVGELSGLGADTLVIRPGKEPSGPTEFIELLLSDSLKQKELDEILNKDKVPSLVSASPEILVPGSVSYRNETFKPLILGFSAEFMSDVLDLEIMDGRAFDEREIKNISSVAVIGSRVKEELFGEENAIGKNIQIKNRKFRVVGVYAPRGQVVFFDVDEIVLVPYTTAQTYLTGIKYFSQIVARAESPELVDRAMYEITQTLRELHNIDDPEKDDFSVQTQQGAVSQITNIVGAFTIFLSFVVAIALIVGGIGIMNVMLVSVTERTKEVGLRKALGATKDNILMQFLMEAVLLTSIGGAFGVMFGEILSYGASFAITRFLGTAGLSVSFPLYAALLGIGTSVIIGLIFGIYPARKASQKSPIDALRYE
jgi:putative ABC transport system permease protein